MILSDFHVHSHFSGDCNINMSLFIEKAISIGVKNLCFTDHHDLDFPMEPNIFDLDIENYANTVLEYKDKYKDKINILLGIELGLQPHLSKDLQQIVDKYPFDFILGSSHLANGIDPYEKQYFEKYSQQEGYYHYFNQHISNAKAFQTFDSYAHLDYVIRYGPFELETKSYKYDDFKEVFDEFFKIIIDNNKGIELNTSGIKHQLGNPHPSRELIKRYRDLGGEIITLGSDSHTPDTLCKYFDEAREILIDAGFKYYTIFKERKPKFIKL